jgi:hypothetical protein
MTKPGWAFTYEHTRVAYVLFYQFYPALGNLNIIWYVWADMGWHLCCFLSALCNLRNVIVKQIYADLGWHLSFSLVLTSFYNLLS